MENKLNVDTNEGRRARGTRVKTIAAALVGLVAGLFLCGLMTRVDAQAPFEQGVQTFNESLNAAAAPSVKLDDSGQATFSRPLEVPPLYAFDSPLDASGRQIILVDSETKRICVYWIRQRGVNSTIELVATRHFELDLKLEDFNCEGLSPGQIREQLDAARR